MYLRTAIIILSCFSQACAMQLRCMPSDSLKSFDICGYSCVYCTSDLRNDSYSGEGLMMHKADLPTRFFLTFGIGAKAWVGPYDMLNLRIHKTQWSPFIQQHLGFRFSFDPVSEKNLANAIGIWYRYSSLSSDFANSFMKEQFTGAPYFTGKRNSFETGIFLMAGERVGLSFSKGWNTLEMQGHPDFINNYWNVGLQVVVKVWKLESELSLDSMFNKHTMHPCLSLGLSIRYKLGFLKI